MSSQRRRVSLKLKKFHPSMMSNTETVAVIGKRRSGKGVLLRDLLYHFRHIPIGTVISPTEKLNKSYSKIVPPVLIHDEYRDDIIDKVLSRQRLIIEKQEKDPNFADVDPTAFLLLDDCMFDNAWQKSTNMKEIFYNGRHYKLTLWLSLQYSLGLSIGMRNNLDWTFLFKEGIVANRKRLYEYFAGMFPNLAAFSAVMDQVTDDYGCLVIHNGASSTKLSDQVFWYKAENRSTDGWRCCLDCFWEMKDKKAGAGEHEQEDDDDDDDDHDDFNKPFNYNPRAIQVDVRKQH